MKNRALFISAIILVIFFLALLTRNGDVALLNVFFLAYLFRSVLAVPPEEKVRLTAYRSVRKILTGSGIGVEVKISVENRSSGTVCLVAEDSLQTGMVMEEGCLRQCFALKGGSGHEWTYTFSSSRGFYRWQSLTVIVSDPSGCLETALELPAAADIAVPPRYRRLPPLKIEPRETLSAPGIVPSRKSGHSTDFYGVREYHPGDPLRALDWKRTARHRNQYFTREFQQERTADIAIVVDGRKNRDLSSGGKNLFESMIELAASLTQMFLHQGQRVGFYVAGENPSSVLPGYGKKQLYKILDCMAAARTGDDGSRDALYTIPVKQFTSRTLMYLLSPADREDLPYLRILRSPGLHITLIRPDTLGFAFSRGIPSDLSRASLRMGRLERQCIRQMLTEMSIPVVDWKVGEPVYPLLLKALNRPGRIGRV